MILQDFRHDPAKLRQFFFAVFYSQRFCFFWLIGRVFSFRRKKMILVVIVEVGILGKHCFFPRMAGKFLSTRGLGIVFCRVLMKNCGKIYPQRFIHSPQGGVDNGLTHKVELFKLWINGFVLLEGTDIFGEGFQNIVHFGGGFHLCFDLIYCMEHGCVVA